MKPSVRTVLAFVAAPAIAPTILATAAAATRPAGEGPTWFHSFLQYFSIAAFVSYGISLTLGTLTFFVLRSLKRESIVSYGMVGVSISVLWGLLAAKELGMRDTLIVAGFLGLLGGSVACAFAAIRVSRKRKNA